VPKVLLRREQEHPFVSKGVLPLLRVCLATQPMRCSCTPSRIQSHHPELAAFLSSTGRTCCPSMIGWICDRSKSFAARRVVMKVSSGGKRRARLAYDSKPRRKCEISTMGPSFSLCLYSLALRHSFLPFSSLFLPFWCSKIK